MTITVLSACGTGESSSPDATTTKALGLQLDTTWGGYSWMVAKGLNPNYFDAQQISYPAQGFLYGSPISYQDSVEKGVDYGSAIIRRGGMFMLVGFSQGAEVVSRLLQELTDGDLTDYMSNFVAGVTFGNPMREHGHTWPNDPTGCTGRGINSSNMLTDTPDNWWDFTNTYDLAGNVPNDDAGDIITDIWDAAGQANLISIPQILNVFVAVAQEDSDILGDIITDLLSSPLTAGATLVEAVTFLANALAHANSSGHTCFSTATVGNTGLTFVQTAINYLNSYAR